MKNTLTLKLTKDEALFLSTMLIWCANNKSFTTEMDNLQEETSFSLRDAFLGAMDKLSEEIHSRDWCQDPDCSKREQVQATNHKGGINFKLL
jgi:hypothetical protein